MNVGPCASTGTSPPLMPSATRVVHSVGGHRQIAAGQRLADAHHVRRDPGVLRGEQPAGAAEAGGDLVEDQQHVVLVARLAQHPQVAGGVEAHAARALHHRLDDHRGQLVGVPRDQLAQVSAYAGSGSSSNPPGGASAKTCSGSTPDHSSCIPPSGSHTDIGCQVSPW